MKKEKVFIEEKTGKEVFIGDTIRKNVHIKHNKSDEVDISVVIDFKLTDRNADILVQQGVLRQAELFTVDDIIRILEQKTLLSEKELCSIAASHPNIISKWLHKTVYELIVRNYTAPKESPEFLFVVNSDNQKIFKVSTKIFVNKYIRELKYNAYLTEHDAKRAVKAVDNVFKFLIQTNV